jgi:hypothetical protein
VESLFRLLAHYYNPTPPPSLAPFINKHDVIVLNHSQAEDYMRAIDDSLALEYSKAMLAGSILQMASKALEEYSSNTNVPPFASNLGITASSRSVRFAVGREVNGIPAGLLVYSGRIQYNHYEEGRLSNKVARAVFDALLRHYYNDMTFDMAYELELPAPCPVSHYIIRHELKWFLSSHYFEDMKEMLTLR